MKKLLILLLLIPFFNCSEDDEDNPVSLVYLRAAIHENCSSERNFTGTDIYAFELTDSGLGNTYWQVGAHPADAVNEQPDLGMNITNPNLDSGQYTISGNNFSANSVFVYYIDATGKQYVTTTDIEGAVNISNDNTTATITIDTDIILTNFETGDTICVSNFEAQIVVNE